MKLYVTTRHGTPVLLVAQTTYRWFAYEQGAPWRGVALHKIKDGSWQATLTTLPLEVQRLFGPEHSQCVPELDRGLLYMRDIADCRDALEQHFARHSVGVPA